LFSSLSTLLVDHRAPVALARGVGGSEAEVATAIGPCLARIIDGLAALADDAGPGLVAALVDRHQAPLADELDDFLDEAPTAPGHDILDRTFGAERGLVVIGLAAALGLAPSLVGRLLPLLAPLITAELALRRDSDLLDDRAMADILHLERNRIARAGLLEGTAFDEAGFDHRRPAAQAEADRVVEVVGDRFAGVDAEVDAGVDRVVEVVGDRFAGVDRVVEVVGDGFAEVDGGPGPALDPPAPRATEAAGAAPGSADGPGQAEPDGAERGDGSGEHLPVLTRAADARGAALTWLGWAVGAVVLVLLLASLLSTCGSAAGRGEDAAGATMISVDADGAPTVGDDEVSGPGTDRPRTEVVPAGPRLFDGPVSDTGGGSGTVGPVPGPGSSIDPDDPVAEDPDVEGSVGEGPEVQAAPGSTLNEVLALDPVTFATASAELTADGRAVLDRVTRFLLADTDATMEIGGHTDSDGDEVANLELSQQRADAVLDHLAAAGVDRTRMIAVGHGEAAPLVPNDSPGNKAINRRIEFTVR
jgi:outer membrane protein OmpA-like peptidoglycan-associated protein